MDNTVSLLNHGYRLLEMQTPQKDTFCVTPGASLGWITDEMTYKINQKWRYGRFLFPNGQQNVGSQVKSILIVDA